MPEEEFDTNQSDDRTATQRVSALEFSLRVEQGKINELYCRTTKASERIDNAGKAFRKVNREMEELKRLDVEMRVLNKEVARLTKLVEDKVSKEEKHAAAESENS